jgi:hypothetical protein
MAKYQLEGEIREQYKNKIGRIDTDIFILRFIIVVAVFIFGFRFCFCIAP